MPRTIAKRMTRFLKRNDGIVPVQFRSQYRLWRRGDEAAALEILDATETPEDKAQDQQDMEEFDAEELLRTTKSPINFMSHGDEEPATEPANDVRTQQEPAIAPDMGRVEADSKKAVRSRPAADPAKAE